jgi:hypothetical protein
MKTLFSLNFSVAPFLLAPSAHLGSEAVPIFAPPELTVDSNALRSLLFDSGRDGSIRSPVIGQVWRRGNAAVATTTIRSGAIDPASGRSGQDLVIGVRAEALAFSGRGWVFSDAFCILYDFLERLAGCRRSVEAATRIIQSINESADVNAFIWPPLSELVETFEQHFFTRYANRSHSMSATMLRVRSFTFLAGRRTLPAASHRSLIPYWKFVDRRLQAKQLDHVGLNGQCNTE